ncbi:hypothetical protein [Streptomyces gobiensis]|uniref:hypothetical protein n=1 Tax=Streptomyces gobiensis TaxID=2875706 RepID=UPI001E512C33|nr:hypothetical protein [Streptomyces gobiensis]UGY93950.1 hypothetical protein test1122_21010 [Streptomyces gobiensis]
MSDELHVNSDELRKLGTSFATHAYDLGRHLSDFRRQTDLTALRDETGVTDEMSRELTELSEVVGRMLGRLQDRLDEIASGMKEGAMNTEAADEDMAELMRGVQ